MDIPTWVIWAVGIASIGQILFYFVAGAVLAITASKIISTMGNVDEMVEGLNSSVNREIMPEVTATVKNVRTISDDAAGATRSVTNTVNHVAHVVNSVTTKMESPVIKTVGVLTGVVAGARSLSNDKAAEKEKPKRRGGLIGILKK